MQHKWYSVHSIAYLSIFVLAVEASEVRAEILFLIPGEIGWRRSLPLHLLGPDVVKDLGLSADAAQRLKQLNEQIQREVDAERRQPSKDDPNKPPDKQPFRQRDHLARRDGWNNEILHAVRNRHIKELNELLTSQQQERLYQIHIQKQRQPTDALSDSGIAKALGLTDAQRSQIYQTHWKVTRAEMDEIKSGDESTVVPGSDALYEACPEKIMKILSDDQRQKFEELRGTPLSKAPVETVVPPAKPQGRAAGAVPRFAKCVAEAAPPNLTSEAVPLFRFVNIGDYKGKTVRLESSPDKKITFKPIGRFGQIVETAGGKPIGPAIDAGTMWTAHHPFTFTCWAFSPDGKHLVTGSSFVENSGSHGGEMTDCGRIEVWDLATSKKADQYAGRVGGIESVQFSEDGKQIVVSARRYQIDGP